MIKTNEFRDPPAAEARRAPVRVPARGGAALPWSLACLLLLGASALDGARAEEAKVKDIEAGDTPGAFALNDHEGKATRLGSGEGHGWYLLAFYPKAATGG